MIARRPDALLRRLAALCGVQTSYADMEHRRVTASRESLLAVLRGLGATTGASDLGDAVRRRKLEAWDWRLEPVIVAWDGEMPAIELRLPERDRGGAIECRLRFEDGRVERKADDLQALAVVSKAEVEGEDYVALRLPFEGSVRSGYHDLEVETGGRLLKSRLIAAPRRAWAPDHAGRWGVFLPLYALHSKQSRGAGDLTDLAALVGWSVEQGASFVGTLPLLASFLDEPFEPSPYTPLSRLFWNELFADPSRPLPGSGTAQPEAPAGLPPAPHELEQRELVDYRATMALKRGFLESQARGFFDAAQDGSEGRAAFDAFVERRPEVADYARFRATVERIGCDWRRWPEKQRGGSLWPGDFDEAAALYHAFAQWRVEVQMLAVAEGARSKGSALYLDLPVGVHPLGYDAWRFPGLFVSGMSVGAPPDVVTTSGQNWGFAPLSPQALRRSGYAYVIDFLRHHFSVAGLLRIDHAMGLHRLYCIPQGAGAREGVYVRYRPEEMYAVLSLESHRHEAVIVGENLGIVPDRVNSALSEHGIAKMYVLGIELKTEGTRPFRPIARNTVASFGTHDLPAFAAFWQGDDFAERVRLGVLDAGREEKERAHREAAKTALLAYLRRHGLLDEGEAAIDAVFRACLSLLARSPAERVLVNLEDLWLETRPQNVPGTTGAQHPNWRRRARYALEELDSVEGVRRGLEVMRRERPGNPEGRRLQRVGTIEA